MRCTWIALAALAAAPALPAAQEPAPAEPEAVLTLDARVITVRNGDRVVIDRGRVDGLEVRDRVVLQPLGGRSLPGRVRVVDERSAEVQLADPRARVAVGTRAAVQLPRSRFAAPPAVEPLREPIETAPPAAPEHPPWENDDAEFQPDMPLLVEVDGVRPEARQSLVSGRIYTIANVNKVTGDRFDSFVRAGTDVHYENPFGKGGELRFEGELNHRTTEVGDRVDENRTRLRVDRVSYAWGGTRFERERHEVGRFLQNGVPELGVLDGYEWGRRLAGGHRVGASAGYLPEMTPEMETGQDFALSAYYQWVPDEREEWTALGAYQKSWHNGAADRDLFVARVDRWATEGWDFHGTAWIDYYSSGDEAKGSGPELTRLYASSGRRFASGDGLEFTLTHDRWPEIDRNAFLPVLAEQLADDHRERLAVEGWTWLRRDRRLHGEFGVWLDEDDSGGDVECGLEQLELWIPEGQARGELFVSAGEFSTVGGLRLGYGVQAATSRWDVHYEYSQIDQVGFSSDNDTIEQHRLIFSTDYQSRSGWSVSLHAGGTLWTEEAAVRAGLYIQRTF